MPPSFLDDPIFCRCGAPARIGASKWGTFVSCGTSKGCMKATTIANVTQQVQEQRTAKWSGSCRTETPGVDVRCVHIDGEIRLALRALSPSPALTALLRTLPGAKLGCFEFTNSIGRQLKSPSESSRALEITTVPVASYEAAIFSVMDVCRPDRVLLPPAFVMQAISERTAIDARPVQPSVPSVGAWSSLHQYQREGIAAGIQRGGRLLLADEMGLGKTIQALGIGYLYREEGVTVVTCPSSLVRNWQREVVRWWTIAEDRVQTVTHRRETVPSAAAAVVVVSYSCVDAVRSIDRLCTLIVDESHCIKNDESQRYKAIASIAAGARHVILLTGTPTVARPIELYAQLSLLNEKNGKLLPSRQEFIRRYCNPLLRKLPNGSCAPSVNGNNRLEELHVLLRPFMIRRRKADVLGQLPAKTRQVIEIDLPEKDAALYRALTAKTGVSLGACVGSIQHFHASGRAKLSTVLEHVTSILESIVDDEGTSDAPQKVLFFAHHQEVLSGLRTVVENGAHDTMDYIFIDGSTPSTSRDELATHFQTSPRCRAAILSMTAAGTGLTLTAANMVVFCELHWTPGLLQQCEDRVHRMGQQSPCTIRYLVARNTVDEAIWSMLQDKLDVNSAVVSEMGAAVIPSLEPKPENEVRPIRGQATLDKWMASEGPRKTIAEVVEHDVRSFENTRAVAAAQDSKRARDTELQAPPLRRTPFVPQNKPNIIDLD